MDEVVMAGIAGAEVMLESEPHESKWNSRRVSSARLRLSSIGAGSTDPREAYRNSSDPNDPMHENFPKVTTDELNALVPVVVSTVGHVSQVTVDPQSGMHEPRHACACHRHVRHVDHTIIYCLCFARIHLTIATKTIARARTGIVVAKRCGLSQRLGSNVREGNMHVCTRIACLDRARDHVR